MSKCKADNHGIMIPNGWKYIPFGEVFEFIPTISLSREKLNLESNENKIYNIHYGDIHATYNANVLDFDNEKRIPCILGESEIKNINLLKDGDLAIADASEDYEGVASNIELKNVKGRKVTGGLHTFIARDKIGLTETGFRCYVLKNPIVSIELKKLATGSKVYGISKSNLASLHIFLPSNEEQKKLIPEFEIETNKLAEKGLRVMGFAMKMLPAITENFNVTELESSLTFIGFAGMIDPQKE